MTKNIEMELFFNELMKSLDNSAKDRVTDKLLELKQFDRLKELSELYKTDKLVYNKELGRLIKEELI